MLWKMLATLWPPRMFTSISLSKIDWVTGEFGGFQSVQTTDIERSLAIHWSTHSLSLSMVVRPKPAKNFLVLFEGKSYGQDPGASSAASGTDYGNAGTGAPSIGWPWIALPQSRTSGFEVGSWLYYQIVSVQDIYYYVICFLTWSSDILYS